MTEKAQLEKRGGCEGVTGHVVKATVGQCLRCGRLPVGGVQIKPTYVRRGGGIDCDDWVHVDVIVLPIRRPAQTANVGGSS